MRGHREGRVSPIFCLLLLLVLAGSNGCASSSSPESSFRFGPREFRAALRSRVPGISDELSRAPFELADAFKMAARERVMAAPPGPERVRALVGFLSDPKPMGLGLEYDWATSANAERTIEIGKGDCVALATVLVGLGRSLGWPIFFAQAHTKHPVTHEFEEVTVLSDHMVVLVLAKSVRMVVDFLGVVDDDYEIELMDDLTAYAHLVNNVAGRRVINRAPQDPRQAWGTAQQGFELATRIQPELARAWNNLGIAYAKNGEFDQARAAYQRAVELDTLFGSPEHNLMIMETRAAGEPTLRETNLP